MIAINCCFRQFHALADIRARTLVTVTAAAVQLLCIPQQTYAQGADMPRYKAVSLVGGVSQFDFPEPGPLRLLVRVLTARSTGG